jgi:RND family efflux transporter MFP subunit
VSAQEELDAARQRLGRSNASYQRVKGLYNIQAISRKDNEKVEFQHQDDLDAVDAAQNRLDRLAAAKMVAEALATNARLTAPFAGVVTERKVEAGNNILPDTLLMKVEDTSSFVAEGLIDQRLAEKVSPGQKAVVLVEELQIEVTAPITEVTPSSAMPGMYVVKAQFNGAGLKSGMTGKMKIPASQRGALLAPASAVVNYRGQTGVYVLKPDLIMVFHPVRFGGRYDQQIEILSGLTAGEEVVVEGLDKAVDGGRAKDARSQ